MRRRRRRCITRCEGAVGFVRPPRLSIFWINSVSSTCGGRETFSCVAKRKSPLRRRSGANGEAGPKGGGQDARSKEKATLLGACRAPPDKSVSRGRAFRQDSCPGEKAPASMPSPLRACRPRLTASHGREDQDQDQVQIQWQRIGAVLAVMWIAFVLGKGLIGYSALETGQGAFVRTIPGQVVVVQKATAAHCTQVDPEPAPPSGSSTSGLSLSSIFHRPYGDDVPSGFHCTINHFIAATPDLTRTLPDRHDFQFSRMFVTAFAI